MGDDFDAIVVGAGMAGCAAAIRLAQAQQNVLLVERGAEAGVKNLSGGILWGHDLDQLLPNWSEEMPLERHIVQKRFGVLTDRHALSFLYQDRRWRTPPYVAYAVLRARTDAWLARQAEAAGATVVTSVPVERLNWEGSKVHGVVQGGEVLSAPVVLLCDGANSRLALGTPIRPNPRLSGEATELGIKEVYRLPPETIAERFGLGEGEGHAEEWVVAGFPKGVMAGGFLYTNRDTLSVGLIVNLQSLFGRGVYSYDLMEQFKLHPAIAPKIAGGELVEYGAKLISSGWASRPVSFFGDGWMVCGDAAGFVFSNGVVIQGMNYAVRSGIQAAETAIGSKASGDYTRQGLSQYERRLERAHVLADFRDSAALDQVKWNPEVYRGYPRVLEAVYRRLRSPGDRSPMDLLAALRAAARAEAVSPSAMARDAVRLARRG